MKTQIFALLGLLAASNTLAFDIVGQGQSRYVKITRQDEWVGFEDCNVRDRNDCRQIGARKFYLVSEIEAQRQVEYLQVAGSVVADVAIGAVAAALTMASLGTLSPYISIVPALLVTPVSGVAVPRAAAKKFDALNPAEQWRQGNVVNGDVLADRTVSVTAPMSEVVARLELVLSKI